MEKITKKNLIFIVLLIVGFGVKSQELPDNKLGKVNVGIVQAPADPNSLGSFNQYLVSAAPLRYQREIRRAKKESSALNYYSREEVGQIAKREYLKKLRKAANRSKDHNEFMERFEQYFPDFKNDIIDQLDLRTLYPVVRFYTFNGYIEDLPDVL